METATRVFIDKGYRRTQMADVTQAMGLSPGAIYRYVQSKEALFDLILRAGATPELSLDNLELPLVTPKPGATLRFLRETLHREGQIKSLELAFSHRPARNPNGELAGIIRELYSRIARHRLGIKLLDRSALDWPQLAELWSGQLRGALVEQLARYLQQRIDAGLLRPLQSPRAAARLIIETVAFFAMHRHHDPFPTAMDDTTAEETVVDTLVHAFAK